jgi:hypothetical protein
MFNPQDQECHETITGSTNYPSYHQHYIPPHSQQQGSRQMDPYYQDTVMDNGGVQGPDVMQSITPPDWRKSLHPSAVTAMIYQI